MQSIPKELRMILAKTVIKEHDEDFVIATIDPNEASKVLGAIDKLGPTYSITSTIEELSVVLRVSDWKKIKKNINLYKVAEPYRLLTFDLVLDLSIVGFLSVISLALAKADVSIYALSTYLKDHILIQKRDVLTAKIVLNKLIEEANL